MGGIGGLGRIKMVSASTPKLRSQQGPQFFPHIKAKAHYNSTKSGNSGINDVVIAPVHTEKTRLKKIIMIIIISMNKSQDTTVIGGRQKLTSTMKLRLEQLTSNCMLYTGKYS